MVVEGHRKSSSSSSPDMQASVHMETSQEFIRHNCYDTYMVMYWSHGQIARIKQTACYFHAENEVDERQ